MTVGTRVMTNFFGSRHTGITNTKYILRISMASCERMYPPQVDTPLSNILTQR